MRIISVIMMLSRLQSDGLRPREARPKAFLLENGGGDWGKALGGGGGGGGGCAKDSARFAWYYTSI